MIINFFLCGAYELVMPCKLCFIKLLCGTTAKSLMLDMEPNMYPSIIKFHGILRSFTAA